jgi:hypothetical protein
MRQAKDAAMLLLWVPRLEQLGILSGAGGRTLGTLCSLILQTGLTGEISVSNKAEPRLLSPSVS